MQTVFTVTSAARMFAPLLFFVSAEAEKPWGIKWIYPFSVRMPLHFLFWLFCSFRTNICFLKLLLPYLDSTAWKPKLLICFWEEHTLVKLCLGVLPSLTRKHKTGLCFEEATELQSQIWTWYKNSWNLKDELKLTGRLQDCLKIEPKPLEVFNIILWVNKVGRYESFLYFV